MKVRLLIAMLISLASVAAQAAARVGNGNPVSNAINGPSFAAATRDSAARLGLSELAARPLAKEVRRARASGS